MINEELAAAIEQIRERLLSVGCIKGVLFFDFYPRQSQTLAIELVAQMGSFLFLGYQRFARSQPFFLRYNRMGLSYA